MTDSLAGADAARIPPEWRTAPDRYGVLATLRVLGGFWLVIAAAPWAVMQFSVWSLLVLAPVLGVFAYKLTILMHDCSHKVLFRSPVANKWVGEACGWILGSDFTQFSRIHWQHHRGLSTLEDPQRPDYVNLRHATPGQVLWHLLRPLVGYNVLFKLVQYNTGKMIRAADAAPAQPMERPPLVPIVLMQALIALLATGFGALWWLVLLYPACGATISLFLSQARGFAEHVAPAGAGSELMIRSHRSNLLDEAVFFTLNFNYHVEHHLHPWVASYHLPKVRALIGRECHTADSLADSIAGTIAKRLEQARRLHARQARAA